MADAQSVALECVARAVANEKKLDSVWFLVDP
jgi:hypothetical protein